jgi:hypothetical protein
MPEAHEPTDPTDPPWPEGMEQDIAALQGADDFAARTSGTDLPFGVTRRHFELDGLPVRMLSPLAIPERLDPTTGRWEPLADFATRLTFEARAVSEAELDGLVAAVMSEKPAEEWAQYLD